MKAYFKRISEGATLPSYGTDEAACCDLYLSEELQLDAGQTAFGHTGLVAIPPKGYHWQIYLRSSAPRNHPGLILANHVGIVDSDYSGPEDEIKLLLTNMSMNHIYLSKGERVAQMRLVENVRPEIEELKDSEEKDEGTGRRRGAGLRSRSRGGFGSTGK